MGQAAKSSTELISGTLDTLIPKTASRGAMHGYAVAQAIQVSSRDVLKVEEGALYPALHGLENTRVVEVRVGRLRKQPPRQVLHTDCSRPARARTRSGVVEPRLDCHRPHHAGHIVQEAS
jgi:Transcriptional regulator PadR-like family